MDSDGKSSILSNGDGADSTRNTAKGNTVVGHDQENIFGFSKIEGAHSREEDRAAVNPNFGKLPDYNNNCSRCAAAYEMRRRGFDVEAKPTSAGGWENLESVFDNAKRESLFSWFPTEVERELQTKIGRWGEGARGIIGGYWRAMPDGGGHSFFVEVIDGKPIFSDPQNPRANAHKYITRMRNVRFCRVDNLNVNDEIKKHCQNKGDSK